MRGRTPSAAPPVPAGAGTAVPANAPVAVLTVALASTSIVALVLHALGWLRMPYAVSFLTLPGLVLLLGLMVWAGRVDHAFLRDRLAAGTIGGLLGLLAYDLGRWLLVLTVPLGFDPFAPIRGFGTFITGRPAPSAAAAVAGWAYHVSNGWTFGVAYAVIFGPARWWWGLAWGLFLEGGMLLVYPLVFAPLRTGPFLVVSITGHALFGATLGRWCATHLPEGAAG
ncbi:MAG TPA: hypothetical protein VF519_13340 [Mycobacteriales bacterium]|jgi:hypothetical protein